VEAEIALEKIFEGWEGYNTSIVHAIQPLTQEQLTWRPAIHLRSVGELASHLAIGRIEWFARLSAPRSMELRLKADELGSESAIASNKDEILHWLEDSWQMISQTMAQWNVQDLSQSILQPYWGKVYRVTYQWVIWRILTHDVHHGGELAFTLGLQGLRVPELGDMGGHITRPPLAE